MIHYKKEVIWLLIPFIYGFLVNQFLVMVPMLSQLVFAVFWFFIGYRFAHLKISKTTSFLFGNSLWAVSFILFIWQFLILDGTSRNLVIAAISQYYILPFMWIGTKVTLMFSNILNSTNIMLLAFLSMFVIFLLGFVLGLIKNRKTNQ